MPEPSQALESHRQSRVGILGPVQDAIASRVPFFYGWIQLPIILIIQVASSPGQTFGVSVFKSSHKIRARTLPQRDSAAPTCWALCWPLFRCFMSAPSSIDLARAGFSPASSHSWPLPASASRKPPGSSLSSFPSCSSACLAQGSMGLLTANSMAMWFNRRLGLAAGIVSTGSAISMGMVPSFNLWLIDSFGWRWAYAILGLCVAGIVLPLLSLLFRNRPEDLGQRPDGAEVEAASPSGNPVVEKRYDLAFAIRTRAYWIMAVTISLPSMIITGIHFHAVQIYLDAGMVEADAATMFAIFALSGATFVLLGGVMADRFRLNLLLSVSMVGISTGIWLLIQVDSAATSALFATALGAGLGIFMAVSSTLWVRYYGRAHLGKIRGTLVTVEVAASSAGPLLLGVAHDLFGSYNGIPYHLRRNYSTDGPRHALRYPTEWECRADTRRRRANRSSRLEQGDRRGVSDTWTDKRSAYPFWDLAALVWV